MLPRPLRLYHGTADVHLPAILKQGLLPGRDGVVYLTDTQAIGFARMAVHRENREQGYRSKATILPVVLEIDATGLNSDGLKPFQRPGADTIGTCTYAGVVPASLITRHAFVDPEKAPELWRWAWDLQVWRGIQEKSHAPDDAYSAVCRELNSLVKWVFGEAPPDFDGPPERERAAISIMSSP